MQDGHVMPWTSRIGVLFVAHLITPCDGRFGRFVPYDAAAADHITDPPFGQGVMPVRRAASWELYAEPL